MEAKLNIFKKLNQTDNFKLTIYLKRVPSPDPFFWVRLSLRFQKMRFKNSDFKMCDLKK